MTKSKPSSLSEVDNPSGKFSTHSHRLAPTNGYSAVFEFRVLKTWDIYESGKHNEAEESGDDRGDGMHDAMT